MRWSECNLDARPICYCWTFLEGTATDLQLLPWLRRLRPELPIVVLCDPRDADRQKEATRLGAKDVLLRPVSEEQIESVIRRHLGSSTDDGKRRWPAKTLSQWERTSFF